MKSCLVHVVLILWYTSISSLCRNAHASNCGTDELSCNISGRDSQPICIPPSAKNTHNLSVGQALNITCRWTGNQSNRQYRWNIRAPKGWKILLKVNSNRTLKFKAGNRNKNIIEAASFDSIEDPNFPGVDEFLSTNRMIWIQANVNADRFPTGTEDDGFNETFHIIARTVKVTGAVDTRNDGCDFCQLNRWDDNGYQIKPGDAEGSLIIQCDRTFFNHLDFVISFFYIVDLKALNSFRLNGSLQFVYGEQGNLMKHETHSLYVKFNISQCDSLKIQFDASGKMELNIYNVTVQGLVYDDNVKETACMPSSTSNSLSTSSTSTTAEGNTSFSQENMTTWIFDTVTMTTERTDADGLPIFLIPTVSGVAIFLLVFLVVLCICLRKRCHTNQSRGRDSAPPDDQVSFNNEQHEYCEVRPSVKSPPSKTASGVTDQSVGHKNYTFVVTGPAIVADEETLHLNDKNAEVNTANNKVLSNGPVYTLVDMDKKARDREEKANNAHKRGNAYVSDVDKLDFIPVDEYETVTVSPPLSPEASTSLRPDSYPLSEYETVSPPMSPVAMASELERPYDTLQRGPVQRKQTATSPTSSTVVKNAQEEADHDDALNVYNEIATPAVVLKESAEGSEAYQHLQRPLSKRPKAGAPLPVIPDEGYGRLDLGGSGASNQTDLVTDQVQDPQGPKSTQVDPMYAILEEPAEAKYVPDDEDPEYDLLDACV